MSHTVLYSSSLRTVDTSSCRVVDFNRNRIEQSIAETKSFLSSEPLLAVPTSALVHVIKQRDLMLIEGDGNYTILWLNNGKKITMSRTMKHIEKMLSATNFLRIHQSYIVNKIHVKSVEKDGLTLTSGRKLNIARSRRKSVQSWLSIIRIL